ncbi:PhzF family phenazine biosynthesis protein [Pseudomonas sp. MWU12-2534b]|nr:PhzF family phenazine biosynthesis protein [Pseudomonas sp. MWU12-2534b]
MQLEFQQIDAFSDQPFAGNPAMVYRLDAWLDDALMQQIAVEHNLAETAFVVREAQGWRIRWFTPATEVPLCGHATLASAYVLFEVHGEPGPRIEFLSRSGPLSVTREGGLLWLDFPLRSPRRQPDAEQVAQILGARVIDLQGANELLAVLESEQAVRDCRPDMAALANLPWPGVIVTARGERHDFVSRYFAPAIGIDEDPVTGSTHCCLTPYWAQQLDKQQLSAYQCSARGGALFCRLEGERVKIGGHARLIASGHLHLE